MKKIQTLSMILLLLLPFSVSLKRVEANSVAVVSVLPSEIPEQNVGERVYVNITITNVINLSAYEIKIFYNSTQLGALWTSLPSNHFLKPLEGETFYIAKNTTDNAYNATHKFIWFAGTLAPSENARTGSDVLIQVVFSALAVGGPYPVAVDYPGNPYPAKLSGPPPPLPPTPLTPIPCTSTPAQITVVPEFPATMFIVALMTVTLIAVALGKAAWLRKRKVSFVV